MGVALAARGVGHDYRRQGPVLEGIDLEVRRGEVTTVIGPNGAGKTTLLRCFVGALTPTRGTVTLGDVPLSRLELIERARRVAHVPQSEPVVFPVSVFDRILLGRRPHLGWRPDADDLRAVARAITALDLERLAHRDIGQLSGGERQKVLIAAAVAQETEVVVLDEPTSHLDIEHQLELTLLLRRLADSGVAVLQTMHDLNLASGTSDRLAVLHRGRLVAQGPPQILDAAVVREVYGVDCDVVDHDGRPVLLPRTVAGGDAWRRSSPGS